MMPEGLALPAWAYRRVVARRPILLAYVSLTILPVVEATTMDGLPIDARAVRQQSCALPGKRFAVGAQHSLSKVPLTRNADCVGGTRG
jgi:hypothetical protein